MPKPELLLPFADYERIYQVLYTALAAAGGHIDRGCVFYAMAGRYLLHEHYGLNAQFVAGAAQYLVHEGEPSTVVAFGRYDGDEFVSDEKAFHCWLEIGDTVIDFMAPIFCDNAKGNPLIARRMFQKQLPPYDEPLRMERDGHFFSNPNPSLTQALQQSIVESDVQLNLILESARYFRKPPDDVDPAFRLKLTRGREKAITLNAPAIDGAW